MSKSDGLWTDLCPVQQFLHYDKVWSNFFGQDSGDNAFRLHNIDGMTPSGATFTQISGGVLVRW